MALVDNQVINQVNGIGAPLDKALRRLPGMPLITSVITRFDLKDAEIFIWFVAR
jgi:hypothetical protein